nr:hypothetical protein CFP56_00938 [Quercus suber]
MIFRSDDTDLQGVVRTSLKPHHHPSTSRTAIAYHTVILAGGLSKQRTPVPTLRTSAETRLCPLGSRKANAATTVKFCSDRCKRTKPSAAPASLDARIERAVTALLQGQAPEPPIAATATDGNDQDDDGPRRPAAAALPRPKAGKKGDPRLIVKLSDVELAVFGDRSDPAKTFGRKKNRLPRGVREAEGEWRSVDMLDSDDDERARPGPGDSDEAGGVSDVSLSDPEGEVDGGGGGGGVKLIDDHVRLPQAQSEVNFSVGGERGWAEKISETPEMLAKRREGQKRADEKELVKKAARRAVVFGLLVDAAGREDEGRGGGKRGGKKDKEHGEEKPTGEKVRRKCEALMHGQVVEPSFAKGDWEIRWREGLE